MRNLENCLNATRSARPGLFPDWVRIQAASEPALSAGILRVNMHDHTLPPPAALKDPVCGMRVTAQSRRQPAPPSAPPASAGTFYNCPIPPEMCQDHRGNGTKCGMIQGHRLDAPAFDASVGDVAAGRYSVPIAAFLSTCAGGRMDLRETIELTRAMWSTWASASTGDARQSLTNGVWSFFAHIRCSGGARQQLVCSTRSGPDCAPQLESQQKVFSQESTMIDRRGGKRVERWLFAGWVVFAGLALATAPGVTPAQASPQASATRSSSEQGVTGKVTPNSTSSPDNRWQL